MNNAMNEALADTRTPWGAEEFETLLRGKSTSYHIHHPFHVMMAEGKLNAAQLRGWVANRFYYQISIPLKDAAILSNCDDREIRREWILRILDHDGFELNGLKDEGGYFGRLMGASSLSACIPSLKDLIDGPVQVVAPGEPFGHLRAVRRIIAKSTCFHQPGY